MRHINFKKTKQTKEVEKNKIENVFLSYPRLAVRCVLHVTI